MCADAFVKIREIRMSAAGNLGSVNEIFQRKNLVVWLRYTYLCGQNFSNNHMIGLCNQPFMGLLCLFIYNIPNELTN